jgi:hypothetical protein
MSNGERKVLKQAIKKYGWIQLAHDVFQLQVFFYMKGSVRMYSLLVRAVANFTARALFAHWSYLMDVSNFNINITHAAM